MKEYRPWLAIDTKYHEDFELLLTVNESSQITHINCIHTDHLEIPVPCRKMYGHPIVAAERRKKSVNSYRPSKVQPRQIGSPTYRRTTETHRNWKKQQNDLKKLVFDASYASSKASNSAAPHANEEPIILSLDIIFVLKRRRLLSNAT
ncbi:hypothetical protein M9H77_22314 [Catharanthus roseus]|uniref:Uncharacterized protein n=1 Tax=Catharanthus roseus TaxID=4058 RepID=A0ACC0AQT9_CATRO|nr:hypothetical protein M9H77_22314 [Catharanthus roseus]